MTMLRNEAPTRLLPLSLVFLAACGGEGESPRPDFASDVDECHHNLREIYNGLRAMKTESGWQPTRGGVGFFGELISSGFWPDTAENRAKLTSILKFHVVSGRVFANDVLAGHELKTLQGTKLTARLEGKKAFVNGAQIVKTDIDASNGVIHVIDSVLIPQ